MKKIKKKIIFGSITPLLIILPVSCFGESKQKSKFTKKIDSTKKPIYEKDVYKNLLAITSQNVNQIIVEARAKNIKLSSRYYLKPNEKIRWPNDISNIDFSNIKGLDKINNPFQGDISKMNIIGVKLKGIDVSQVTQWPINLEGINWDGVIKLLPSITPFKGDISHLNIFGTTLKRVDVSQVTQWPLKLLQINWNGVIGIKMNQLLFNSIDDMNIPMIGDISKWNLSKYSFVGIDVSQVTKWPIYLKFTNWSNVIGLTKENTPFKGDISHLNIFGSTLYGVDVSQVTKWPKDLSFINWDGIKGIKLNQFLIKNLNISYQPMTGDISLFDIRNSILKDVDVSQVIQWPKDLSNINWDGIKGLNKDNTPFKGDISHLNIFGSIFKGVDVSEVTKWPVNLSGINWEGVIGLTPSSNPFKGDISHSNIHDSIFKGVDVSEVTKWPANLSKINWKGVIGIKSNQLLNSKIPMIGDISQLNIKNSILKDVDVSQVTQWPKDLSGINWDGIKGLNKDNTPFKGDISHLNIFGSIFKGVDVSEITKWPVNLSGINWEGVIGLSPSSNLFKGDISHSNIHDSIFKGVDVSEVTKWPANLSKINWKGVIGIKSNQLLNSKIPMIGDISQLKLNTEINDRNEFFVSLKAIDVSQVTKWPKDLSRIKWGEVIGLSSFNTPFKEDISNLNIWFSELKGVDVSEVTRWPTNLELVDWEGIIGLSPSNTPFKGDISHFNIYKSILKGIDISQVTKWPTNLWGVQWVDAIGISFPQQVVIFSVYEKYDKTKPPIPLIGDISNQNISESDMKKWFVKNKDFSKVTKLPFSWTWDKD